MKRFPTSAAEALRWVVAWAMYGAGRAVYWFDMETSIGSYLWQWMQWPIHRLEAFLTDGSGRIQGNGAGPWEGVYEPPFRANLNDEIPW